MIATIFGFVSVLFAARAHVFTWPTGIVSSIFLFILFFQVRLYADMFLQIYFFTITLYGWYHWKKKKNTGHISSIRLKNKIILISILIVATIFFGYLMKNIHVLLPAYFKEKASFPFADSFVLAASIMAQLLLAQKKIENWYLWLAIDVVCVYIYFKKEIYFLSLEYLVFLILVVYGIIRWKKHLKND